MERLGATDAWDFVNQSFLRAGRVTASGITFTRASAAYAERSDGIWQSFGSGVARITDKGLLVEGSRINRALYSRDLTNPAWTATNVTVARNQVGIDGTANSACSLTATAGNGTVLQAITHASTARYFSIWVKRITGTGTVNVTLDNGSTWTAVTVTSGWTQVGAAQTLANPTVGVRIVTSGDAIAVDFAQLEDGGFATSPILVEGTAVTRAADNASISATGFAYPLTLFAQVQVVTANLTTRSTLSFQVDGNNGTYMRVATTDAAQIRVDQSGSTQANVLSAATIGLNQTGKLAARVATNNVNVALNGVAATTDTTATMPAMSTVMQFGATNALTEPLNSYIRQAAIIPLALDNTKLQEITT